MTTPTHSVETRALYRIFAYSYFVIATIAFVALAFASRQNAYFGFDLSIAHSVQAVQASWFDALMQAISLPGYPPQLYVFLASIFIILFFMVSRWAAWTYLFAAVCVGVVGFVVKTLVDRPRPSADLIHVLHPNLDGGKYSFPAGHVESYVVLLGFLFFLAYISQSSSWMRTFVLSACAVMIALIGLSRVYSGEHWLSDVLGGYLLGSILLIITIGLYNKGKSRFLTHTSVSRTSVRATADGHASAPITESVD